MNFKNYYPLYATALFLFYACSTVHASIFELNYKVDREKTANYPVKNNKFTFKNRPEEIKLTGKENFNLGVAVSGGGIRSAFYAIGAIKALDDTGILKDVDVFSSVSGGSYAMYWLYSSSHFTSKMDFAERAFDDKYVLGNMCELQVRGKLAPLTGAVADVWRNRKPQEYYRCRIEYGFGWLDEDISIIKDQERCVNGKPTGMLLSSLRSDMENNGMPFLIVNSTLVTPESTDGWNQGLYEMTPLSHGNDAYGYMPWSSKVDISFSRAVTMSGAAQKDILKQKMVNVHTGIGSEYIELSDGGHSENLGVVALIKRGVQKIIVLDAEYDEKLTFEAYFILKDRLKHWGITLTSDALDGLVRDTGAKNEYWWAHKKIKELKEGMFKAEAFFEKDGKKTLISTLYYLKMSTIGSIKQEMVKEYTDVEKELEVKDRYITEHSRFDLNLRTNALSNGDYDCKKVNEVRLNDGSDPFIVRDYIREETIIYTEGIREFTFPHVPTIDQSFARDLTGALIGLGYREAEKLKKLME